MPDIEKQPLEIGDTIPGFESPKASAPLEVGDVMPGFEKKPSERLLLGRGPAKYHLNVDKFRRDFVNRHFVVGSDEDEVAASAMMRIYFAQKTNLNPQAIDLETYATHYFGKEHKSPVEMAAVVQRAMVGFKFEESKYDEWVKADPTKRLEMMKADSATDPDKYERSLRFTAPANVIQRARYTMSEKGKAWALRTLLTKEPNMATYMGLPDGDKAQMQRYVYALNPEIESKWTAEAVNVLKTAPVTAIKSIWNTLDKSVGEYVVREYTIGDGKPEKLASSTMVYNTLASMYDKDTLSTIFKDGKIRDEYKDDVLWALVAKQAKARGIGKYPMAIKDIFDSNINDSRQLFMAYEEGKRRMEESRTRYALANAARRRLTDEGFVYKGTLGALGMGFDMLAAMGAGAAGGIPGAFAYSYARFKGDFEDKLTLDYGVAPEKADLISTLASLPYAAVETLQVKQFANLIKGTGKDALKKKVLDTMTVSVKKALKDAGIATSKTYAKETGEEVLQNAIEMAASALAKEYANADVGYDELYKAFKDDSFAAARDMLFLSAVGGAGRVAKVGIKRASRGGNREAAPGGSYDVDVAEKRIEVAALAEEERAGQSPAKATVADTVKAPPVQAEAAPTLPFPMEADPLVVEEALSLLPDEVFDAVVRSSIREGKQPLDILDELGVDTNGISPKEARRALEAGASHRAGTAISIADAQARLRRDIAGIAAAPDAKTVKDVAAATGLNMGKVRVVDSRKELPERVRQKISLRNPAVYDNKTGYVYVIADQVGNVADVPAIIQEEIVGHRGILGLLGGKATSSMVDDLLSIPDVQRGAAEMADRLGLDMEKAADRQTAVLEEVARRVLMQGRRTTPSLKNRILGAIRSALRSMGANLRFTNADLERLIYRAWKREAVGEDTSGKAVMDAMRKRLLDMRRQIADKVDIAPITEGAEAVGAALRARAEAALREDFAHLGDAAPAELRDILKKKGIPHKGITDQELVDMASVRSDDSGDPLLFATRGPFQEEARNRSVSMVEALTKTPLDKMKATSDPASVMQTAISFLDKMYGDTMTDAEKTRAAEIYATLPQGASTREILSAEARRSYVDSVLSVDDQHFADTGVHLAQLTEESPTLKEIRKRKTIKESANLSKAQAAVEKLIDSIGPEDKLLKRDVDAIVNIAVPARTNMREALEALALVDSSIDTNTLEGVPDVRKAIKDKLFNQVATRLFSTRTPNVLQSMADAARESHTPEGNVRAEVIEKMIGMTAAEREAYRAGLLPKLDRIESLRKIARETGVQQDPLLRAALPKRAPVMAILSAVDDVLAVLSVKSNARRIREANARVKMAATLPGAAEEKVYSTAADIHGSLKDIEPTEDGKLSGWIKSFNLGNAPLGDRLIRLFAGATTRGQEAIKRIQTLIKKASLEEQVMRERNALEVQDAIQTTMGEDVDVAVRELHTPSENLKKFSSTGEDMSPAQAMHILLALENIQDIEAASPMGKYLAVHSNAPTVEDKRADVIKNIRAALAEENEKLPRLYTRLVDIWDKLVKDEEGVIIKELIPTMVDELSGIPTSKRLVADRPLFERASALVGKKAIDENESILSLLAKREEELSHWKALHKGGKSAEMQALYAPEIVTRLKELHGQPMTDRLYKKLNDVMAGKLMAEGTTYPFLDSLRAFNAYRLLWGSVRSATRQLMGMPALFLQADMQKAVMGERLQSQKKWTTDLKNIAFHPTMEARQKGAMSEDMANAFRAAQRKTGGSVLGRILNAGMQMPGIGDRFGSALGATFVYRAAYKEAMDTMPEHVPAAKPPTSYVDDSIKGASATGRKAQRILESAKALYTDGNPIETATTVEHLLRKAKLYNHGGKDSVKSLDRAIAAIERFAQDNADTREAKAHEAAMAETLDTVETTQQSSQIKDLPDTIAHGGSWGRSAMQFITSPAQQYSKEVEAFNAAKEAFKRETGRAFRKRDLAPNSKFWTTPEGIKLAKSIALNHGVLPALQWLVGVASAGALGGEMDEDDWWELAVSMMLGPFGAGVVLFGSFMQDITKTAFGAKTWGSGSYVPVLGVGDDAVRLGKSLRKRAVETMDGIDTVPEGAMKAISDIARKLITPYRDVNRAYVNRYVKGSNFGTFIESIGESFQDAMETIGEKTGLSQ